MSDWPIVAMLGGVLLLIVLLIGLVFWSGQNFADRCERAGGVLVNWSVCVTKDSEVLLVQR